MRIIYLHQYFNTPEMVGGTRSYEIGRRLVAAGHDVHMVTSWRTPDKRSGWFESIEGGMRVHWLPVEYSNLMDFKARIKAFIRFATYSAGRAAALKGDVVYATSTPLTIAIPGAYASWRTNTPMIFELRDLWPDVPIAMGVLKNTGVRWASRRLEGFAYSRAKHIIALTPTMRDFVSGKGVPLEKISVISNAADLERFASVRAVTCTDESKPERFNRDRVLVYCGGLGPAHGPTFLVHLAVEFLRIGAPIVLLVAGDGSLRLELERFAEKTGCLNKTIRFLGSIPQQEVPRLYADADASIMTMQDCELLYRHSVQNKFFDSLAAGKPVFANYVGWASQLAEQHEAGVILRNDDTRSAAQLIVEKVKDDAWLERAGGHARALAESQFSWDDLAARVERVLLGATD
ncbi:glycosyltransferase family 4 protein [Thiohalomonas denitrificans]|uniref:glycosyltransferase family 4 protein n=1 Tax=Thiohalomonas denitrificans TaxID=415747 RepID=UPI0026EFB8B3|nr:glycosyltransferase family 4 protein [Thiohalomonas denitrificans]